MLENGTHDAKLTFYLSVAMSKLRPGFGLLKRRKCFCFVGLPED